MRARTQGAPLLLADRPSGTDPGTDTDEQALKDGFIPLCPCKAI